MRCTNVLTFFLMLCYVDHALCEESYEMSHVRSKRDSSVSGVTCYRSPRDCEIDCDMVCYRFDRCNGQYGPFWACLPNIPLIVGLVIGGFILVTVLTCVCCFCIPCCCLAQCLARRRNNQGQVVQPPPVVGVQGYPIQQAYPPPAQQYSGQYNAGFSSGAYPPPATTTTYSSTYPPQQPTYPMDSNAPPPPYPAK